MARSRGRRYRVVEPPSCNRRTQKRELAPVVVLAFVHEMPPFISAEIHYEIPTSRKTLAPVPLGPLFQFINSLTICATKRARAHESPDHATTPRRYDSRPHGSYGSEPSHRSQRAAFEADGRRPRRHWMRHRLRARIYCPQPVSSRQRALDVASTIPARQLRAPIDLHGDYTVD